MNPDAREKRARKMSRSAKIRRLHWKPVAVYSGLVILALTAVALWDRAYEAQQAARFRPPPRPVLAKNIVEGLVGSGTVENVAFDEKAGTLEMSVKDVLVKSGQTPAEMKKNLTAEGSLSVQVLQSQITGLRTITLHFVRDGKVLATVRNVPGQTQPAVEFSPDLK